MHDQRNFSDEELQAITSEAAKAHKPVAGHGYSSDEEVLRAIKYHFKTLEHPGLASIYYYSPEVIRRVIDTDTCIDPTSTRRTIFEDTERFPARLHDAIAAKYLPPDLFAALETSLAESGPNPLRVGIAEAAITPTWPTPLWGYSGRLPYSVGVMDDIFAKAFLFDCGKRFLVVTMDVGAIGFPQYRHMARRIHETVKIDEDPIMIQCTHDHSAPANIDVTGTNADRRFQEPLADEIVALARQAQQNLAPAKLSYGQTNSYIALNRRVGNRANTWDKDSGPIDSTFSVLLVTSPEGRNRGVIVNYPSHPVTLRPDQNKISADFPGVLYRELGRALNCPVAYMQGCCGDMIPKIFGTTKEMQE